MFRSRIIFRLLMVFFFFSAMVFIPFGMTVVKHVDNMIKQEEALLPPGNSEYAEIHRQFSSRLVEQMLPYIFYVFVMSFIMSIFFLRKTLVSLKQLQMGSNALKDGRLDTRLEVITDDELGEATRAFNEMAAVLRARTEELQRKNLYLEAMTDPLWVVDEENNLIDVNPAFTRLFGYEKDDILGANIYDFFDEENAAIMRQQLEEKRKIGISSTYEITVLTKDGSHVPVLISGSPIFEDGRMTGKIGIFKDFREQRGLLDELRTSKDYVETIMDSLEDHLMVIDKDYRIVKANKTASMRSGMSVLGKTCHVVSHGLDAPCWTDGQECPAQSVFLTGRNYRTTHQHVSPSGEKRYHEITAGPVRDASGNIINVIELVRDVTDRMRHEEEIFRKNRELVALNSVAGILNRSLRPDEIFTRVLDKMIEMMSMDGGGIFFIDEMKKEMNCQYHKGISDEYVKILGRIRLGEDIPGKVAVTGQIITTADLSKDQRIERSIVKHSGIKGYCCIPIKGKERIIGVFCLFSFRTHGFTAEEENILNSIGEMTGIALENIKLYERMRELYEQQRKRREDEQAQLLLLSSKLGSAIELPDIMGRVLEHIKGIFRADFVWLMVADDKGDLVVKSSTLEDIRIKDIVYPKGLSSIEGYALDRKAPTVVHDIQKEAKFFVAPEISSRQYGFVISVPMHMGDKPVGVYSLYYMGAREFKEEETHFLRIIANILSVSIERSEYYLRAITEKGLSETILQSVADGVITIDVSGKTISVNKAFEKMTGVPACEAVGLQICDALRSPGENAEFRLSFCECFEAALGGATVGKAAEMTTAYGNRIYVMISSAPVLDVDGRVTGVVNLLKDISREREIDRMKTELIRSVSHEFRTPLSAIVGMTEMIIDGDVDEGVRRKYLDTILSEGVRLSKMVSDLLSIARIESGKEAMRIRKIDMDGLLKSVVDSFAPVIEKKRARLGYDIGAVSHFVGDEEKMMQLLMNLVDNSLTYSNDECSIDIKTAQRDGRLEVVVTDDGWGIPEEDMPRLTERFFRGRHGRKVKGTGLGLSLCNEIVRMHGGTMNISSRPGAGTRVSISFPIREAG